MEGLHFGSNNQETFRPTVSYFNQRRATEIAPQLSFYLNKIGECLPNTLLKKKSPDNDFAPTLLHDYALLNPKPQNEREGKRR